MPSPPGRITFGQQLRSAEVGGFVFTETLHPPDLELPRHDHEHANFNLTVRGRCRETMRGTSDDCGPSCLVIKPPGEAHSNHYGPAGARCLIVEVTPARLSSLGPHNRLLGAPLRLDRGPLVALAARMYAELRHRGPGSDLVLEGLGLEFLGLLDRQAAPMTTRVLPRWLRAARDWIHAHHAEPLSLSTLAATAGVDASHFARAFRRWFGCSAGTYVRHLRLQHVAEQLAASDRPLVELAHAAGFCDQSHLTNAFKRQYGLTPAQYRKAMGPPFDERVDES